MERSREEVLQLVEHVVEEAKTWGNTPFRKTMKGKGRGTHCLGYIAESYALWFPELKESHLDAIGLLGAGLPERKVEEVIARFANRGFTVVDPPPQAGDVVMVKAYMVQLGFVVSATEMMLVTKGMGVTFTMIDERYRKRMMLILRRRELCQSGSSPY